MKLLTRADNLLAGNIWTGALRAAGIECELRNTALSGAMGEIPYLECAPQIWIARDEDENRARDLLAEIRQAPRGAGWTCACGERLEAQFGSCWNCGAPRP